MSFELKNVVLTYFPIQGRAAPLRLLMEDAGVEYTESNDVAAFREDKMDCELYPFNQLPRLTVNGIHLAQQGAILRLLAKAKGAFSSLFPPYHGVKRADRLPMYRLHRYRRSPPGCCR